MSLKQTYSRLYAVSLQHGCQIKQMGKWEGELWTWQFSWMRNLFVWENTLLDKLLRDLGSAGIKRGAKDFWLWEVHLMEDLL